MEEGRDIENLYGVMSCKHCPPSALKEEWIYVRKVMKNSSRKLVNRSLQKHTGAEDSPFSAYVCTSAHVHCYSEPCAFRVGDTLFFHMVKSGTYSLLQLCSSTNNRHRLLFSPIHLCRGGAFNGQIWGSVGTVWTYWGGRRQRLRVRPTPVWYQQCANGSTAWYEKWLTAEHA